MPAPGIRRCAVCAREFTLTPRMARDTAGCSRKHSAIIARRRQRRKGTSQDDDTPAPASTSSPSTPSRSCRKVLDKKVAARTIGHALRRQLDSEGRKKFDELTGRTVTDTTARRTTAPARTGDRTLSAVAPSTAGRQLPPALMVDDQTCTGQTTAPTRLGLRTLSAVAPSATGRQIPAALMVDDQTSTGVGSARSHRRHPSTIREIGKAYGMANNPSGVPLAQSVLQNSACMNPTVPTDLQRIVHRRQLAEASIYKSNNQIQSNLQTMASALHSAQSHLEGLNRDVATAMEAGQRAFAAQQRAAQGTLFLRDEATPYEARVLNVPHVRQAVAYAQDYLDVDLPPALRQ